MDLVHQLKLLFMKHAYFFLTLSSFLFILCANAQDNNKKTIADIIYKNATIWTGNNSNPSATSIAVAGNKILYVGNNADPYTGSNTKLIDAKGKLIVPGFIDNHTHFLTGGYQLTSVNLREAASKEAFTNTLKTYIAKLTDDRWIQGGDWDHESMGGELPTKEWIDGVTGNHPVFVSRYDGHMALANSVALKLAGIDKNTKNPPGGEIVRDPVTNEPTGVLKDEAMGLVNKIIPEPSEKELDEMLQRASVHALKNGVTQVNDVNSYGGWLDLKTYTSAHKKNQLSIRIYSFVALSTWKRLADYVMQNGRGDDMLHWGGLKGFVDGSLGSTTAWFYQPYLDDKKSTGLIVTDTNDLRRDILAADAAGLHVTVHAIGDQANDWLLNVFEEAEKKKGNSNSRFRIEHAQHLSAAAINRFAALNVIPSMQPYHAIDDGRWAYKRLEDDRLKRTYAFKSLLAANATLTFGSDWTVAPLNPLEGIYAAVTRRTLDDKNPNGWYPEQKITVEDAMRCYTVNNAYAGFHENKTGMLKAGMLADFVILSDNIFTVAPEKIKDVKVLQTILDGKVVYDARKK
jgi:predicted amidohydrolase YtcJ